ncbi:SCP2 sterol-binding domain-containing protein [Novispirillum itersonii]|uniref:SCP2 sterol-binding domain-containing protein n=1 Tax=Novispirillum itersonii TaxID=189 RepID=UPI00038223BB|nr:SCP2 sterol-binding domain-containing protein [Novispirillum itersonii]
MPLSRLLAAALPPVPSQIPLPGLDRLLSPRLGGRLDGMTGEVLIRPTDLPPAATGGVPLAVSVRIGAGGRLRCRVVLRPTQTAEAEIHAPLATLWTLMFGGGLDGDGSFFARTLRMEGDTALAMALRYALEDADLTPSEVLAALPPLPERLTRPLADRLIHHGRTVGTVLRRWQDRLLEPLARRMQRLEHDMAGLEGTVTALSARASRMDARRARPTEGLQ